MPTSAPRRTKIVATLGPATDPSGVVEGLLDAGLDVARINCSHGTRDDHARRTAAVREAALAHSRPVAVLVDIQGPKLRVGLLAEPMTFEDGATVTLVEAAGDADLAPGEVPVSFDIAHVGVLPGQRILLNDGRIKLVCVEVADQSVVCRVVRAGALPLTSRKGVNLPDTALRVSAISEKDLGDLALAGQLEADWVAVSFVSSGAEIDHVRSLLPEGTGIIAKIERPVAVENFDEIMLAADAVMVARGDLGVETPFEQLPVLQKDLISRANLFGVPVVTATEMLESMTTSSRPTRAEVTDVANAVLDGTDAVMLSGETAAGVDPVGAVSTMASVVAAVEGSEHFRRRTAGHRFLDHEHPATAALAAAAVELSRDLHLDVVAVFTETGRTARIVAQTRPRATLVAFAHEQATWRRLALYWGISPVLLPRCETTEAQIHSAEQHLLESRVAQSGDRAVFVAGAPNRTGSASLIVLRTL